MKILVMTYSSKEALEISLGILEDMCKINCENVIVASLNAGAEVESFLVSQNKYKYVLADENDTYGMVLNTVISEFLEEESLAIINEGMSCFPDALSLAEEYLSDEKVGAIVFDKLTYAGNIENLNLKKSIFKKEQLFHYYT